MSNLALEKHRNQQVHHKGCRDTSRPLRVSQQSGGGEDKGLTLGEKVVWGVESIPKRTTETV